ncbi:MAG: gliding motility-associated C-terminal domain-containing protein [Flavobacteriales bacterium]|nr:gliding motility-associated C-terminal domain-containing protein [Flavobacteriales bacterium]MCB9194027.1 gliding motility-associated C-terminal domain-containing protein [Flavobacteriales bacterium]
MELKHFIPIAALLLGAAFVDPASAQEITWPQYEQMKGAGNLPAHFTLPDPGRANVTVAKRPGDHPAGIPKGGGGLLNPCDCWIPPDSSYQLAMQPNDDLSSSLITLPFQFNLYGDLYNTCYINNNGNVSFVDPYFTYSATPFPTADFKMVAPYWADVDTRGDDGFGLNGGTVRYKLTPTAMYVNWEDVGYYGMHTDKKCTFQLIITDGTDPVIGVGNNVSFCYKNMDWTTGDASQGQNGFGGIPSTVGANRGNGVDYIQFGRFDHPGNDYDGPFNNPDGVDWLDGQNFVFTTAVSTQNIPPIASSTFLCDTVRVCTGELVNIEMNFIAPEQDQVTVATSDGSSISNYQEISNTSGNITATIISEFIAQPADTGFHVITYTATDDGQPPLTTNVSIVLDIYYTPAQPPVITGDTVACPGQGVVLTASGGFDDYNWSNGYDGQSVLVGPGTYTLEATAGICRLASNTIVVTEGQAPTPTIVGALYQCGDDPAVLLTDQPYDSYAWSTGSTADSIVVQTGTYSVTVIDANGCEGASASVDVLTAPPPTALFTVSPNNQVIVGEGFQFTDHSTISNGTITNWFWQFDSLMTSNAQDPAFTFPGPGTYIVSLTVTTADGCTDTYSVSVTVVPEEIFVPNVFSPNGDGLNDALTFTNVQYFPNTALKVYNRWGNMIYDSPSYRNNWAPRDIPEGTYFYILTMQSGKTYEGHLTLLR